MAGWGAAGAEHTGGTPSKDAAAAGAEAGWQASSGAGAEAGAGGSGTGTGGRATGGNEGGGDGSGGSAMGGEAGSGESAGAGATATLGGSGTGAGGRATGGSASGGDGSGGKATGGEGGSAGSSGGDCSAGSFDHDNDSTTACQPWSTCEPGRYVVAEGTATTDRICATCPLATFASQQNVGACAAWQDCEPGTYVSKPGSATADRECEDCPSGLQSLQANQSACLEPGACQAGTVEIVPATETTEAQCEACEVGTFCAGGSEPQVDCGDGNWDDDANPGTACVAWTSCGPGSYVTADGTAVEDRGCTACAGGTYSGGSNASSCTAWTSCGPGSYASSPGSAIQNRVCSACPSGTYSTANNAASCTAWKACQAGEYIFAAGTATADRQCNPCASGTFSSIANASVCTAWTTCTAGTFVSAAGSASADRQCSPCTNGYTTTANAPSCTAWTNCQPGQYVSTTGTTTTNRQCSGCVTGFTATTNAPSCSPWTDCRHGEYVLAAGTSSSNRQCAACADGTFSATTNGSSCAASPSCQSLAATCGPSASQSCCTSPPVTGGTFNRVNSSSYPATLSDFRLDKFEATVGRFRKFVTAVVAGWRPSTAAGKHTYLNGGAGLADVAGGNEPGWDSSWTSLLANSTSGWDSVLACDGDATWTTSAGSNESRPINCVNWYETYAFCIWDDAFLPSESEWNYASAGGNQQRTYPWGNQAPGADAALAAWGCYYNGTGTCTVGVTNIAPVGVIPAGNGIYGQSDLAGNMHEWVLDWFAPNATAFAGACADCAYFTTGTSRVSRGGPYYLASTGILTSYYRAFGPYGPSVRYRHIGVRCARAP